MKTLEEAFRSTFHVDGLTRTQRRRREEHIIGKFDSLVNDIAESDDVSDFAEEVAEGIIKGNEPGEEPLCCMKHAMIAAFMDGFANGVVVGVEMERQELPESINGEKT